MLAWEQSFHDKLMHNNFSILLIICFIRQITMIGLSNNSGYLIKKKFNLVIRQNSIAYFGYSAKNDSLFWLFGKSILNSKHSIYFFMFYILSLLINYNIF